jgi:hypothetical protein
MKSKFSLLLIISILSISSFAEDDEAKAVPLQSAIAFSGHNLSPEQMREKVRQSYDMQKEYLKMRIEIMSELETVKLLAIFSRTYYEALIKEGFSSKEAMQLVISIGIPKVQ